MWSRNVYLRPRTETNLRFGLYSVWETERDSSCSFDTRNSVQYRIMLAPEQHKKSFEIDPVITSGGRFYVGLHALWKITVLYQSQCWNRLRKNYILFFYILSISGEKTIYFLKKLYIFIYWQNTVFLVSFLSFCPLPGPSLAPSCPLSRPSPFLSLCKLFWPTHKLFRSRNGNPLDNTWKIL